MTPKQRVINAINHKQTEEVPKDLGGQSNTTLTKSALDSINSYLGIHQQKIEIMAKHFQSVTIPKYILNKFNIDIRSVKPDRPTISKYIKEFDDGSYIDRWGVKYKPAPNGQYFDIVEHPLQNAAGSEIKTYFPFNPKHEGLKKETEDYLTIQFNKNEFAIFANITEAQIFERSWYLRGMNDFLMDMAINKTVAYKILEKVTEIQIERITTFLRQYGNYLDVIKVSDDLAGQLNPLISPDMYREMIKPFHKIYFESIKKYTNAKLALHCCGNLRPLLPDILETGIDIIHPFQHSCPEMEPGMLKQEFGKDLVFWGGMDTQKFLPYASPEEVRKESLKIIKLMARNGGFIFAPTHNIQSDVPLENVFAMYSVASSLSLEEELD